MKNKKENKSIAEWLKEFKEGMRKQEDKQEHVCPHCGRQYNEPWHPYKPWDLSPPYNLDRCRYRKL